MKVDMIGLTVADIAASMAFYKILGVPIPESWDGPYAETTLQGGIRLSWNDLAMVKEHSPNWQAPVGQRVNMAFLCDSVGEVDAKFAEVVAAGYSGVSEPFDAFWGQRYAQVMDPDGAIVEALFVGYRQKRSIFPGGLFLGGDELHGD